LEASRRDGSKVAGRQRHDLPRGAAFMVASAFLFAGMGAMVKLASGSLPNTVVVFFRNAVALAFLLPWVLGRGTTLRTKHLSEHLVRGLAGLASMYLFFYAIAHMRLAEAMLLNYSLPLFIPFVEQAWIAEPVPRRTWWALAIGFLGLIVILKPGFALFDPVALCALGSALLAAVAQVGVRRLTQTEPATRIVFYFTLLSTAISGVPLRITGEGPQERELARRIGHSRAPAELCGKVPADTLRDMLRRAAMVLVPTTGNETFGFAALEAMAAGLPVVAANAGALPEIVGPEACVARGDALALLRVPADRPDEREAECNLEQGRHACARHHPCGDHAVAEVEQAEDADPQQRATRARECEQWQQ